MINRNSASEVDEIHQKVKLLLNANLSDSEIIKQFKTSGLEPYYIETVIANIRQDVEDRKSFRNSMIMGIFYLVSGVAANWFSYSIAENANATYFYLFWGIVVLGIVTIIRGFILYKK